MWPIKHDLARLSAQARGNRRAHRIRRGRVANHRITLGRHNGGQSLPGQGRQIIPDFNMPEGHGNGLTGLGIPPGPGRHIADQVIPVD